MRSDISADVLAQLSSKRIHPFYMADIEFTSGHSYVWTGIGSIAWDGQTWVGLGQFCGISAIQQTAQIQSDNVTLSLNGVDASLISDAMNEVQQNYVCQVYLGFLDDTGAIVIDPVRCFKGRLDVPTFTDDGKTCTISITAENLLTSLQRASNRRYTTPDQQSNPTTATDKGFDYVPPIQAWTGVWGKAGGGGGPIQSSSGSVASPNRITQPTRSGPPRGNQGF